MRAFALVAAFVLGLGACGKKDKSEKSDSIEKFITDAEALRDKMCACKDKGDAAAKKDCAAGVMKELAAWLKAEKPPHGASQDQIKRLKQARIESQACEKEAAGGRAGSDAPWDDDRDYSAELTKFLREERDELCACKDAKCATDVAAKYSEKAKATGLKPRPPTDEDTKNLNEGNECMKKLGAARPGG